MTALSIAAGVALAAWVLAVVAALRLMAYRLPGRGVRWYAVRGYAFFDASQFEPSGRAAHRTFLLATLAFVLAVVGAVVIAIASV